jgi:hypothetical protein
LPDPIGGFGQQTPGGYQSGGYQWCEAAGEPAHTEGLRKVQDPTDIHEIMDSAGDTASDELIAAIDALGACSVLNCIESAPHRTHTPCIEVG